MRKKVPCLRQVFFLLSISTLSASAFGQNVIVTEFMANPAAGEAEWVEIFNRSSSPVDLVGWTLRDRSGRSAALPAATDLGAGARLIITERLPLGSRWNLTPDSVLVATDLPSLNNGGDDIVLRDAAGTTVDSVCYASSWLGEIGVSLERIRTDGGAESRNWAPSTDPSGATPGAPNSVAPPPFDLHLTQAHCTPDSVVLRIVNAGTQTPPFADVECWLLTGGVPQQRLLRQSIPPPPPGTVTEWRSAIVLPGSGSMSLLAVIDCAADSRPLNDSLVLAVEVPVAPRSLLINEIMCEPLPDGCEWIELWNASEYPVRIAEFAVAGTPNAAGARARIPLPAALPAIPPAGYAVIAADERIRERFPGLAADTSGCVLVLLGRTSLGLGNTEDNILLLDAGGRVIDSVTYSSSVHHPFLASTRGRSLELIHPSLRDGGMAGWGSCTEPEGGTPGTRNSIYSSLPPGLRTGGTRLRVSPQPFSPDGDGYEDYCVITCETPAAVNQARLRLFDVNGRLVRTLISNAPAGRQLSVVWDGLDDAGRRARIGPYVALLELLDTANNTVTAARGIVVVAIRL